MPGQMIALLDGDSLTIRVADAPPLVLPALSIADAFEMALSTQTSAVAGLEPAPLGLLLYAGHDEWEAHENEVDAFRDRFTGVKVQLLPSGPLSVLAPAAASDDAVNLLQGSLAVASPLQHGWRAWRVAAVLAATLLCLHLGARGFELNRLRKSEAALDASIQDAFRAAMPGQQNATNARRRVAQRLDALHSGGGGGALLPALSAIAKARNAVPDAKIEGINFREGTLDLRMIAPRCRELRCHRSATASRDLASGYQGNQRQRRELSRTPADPQGGCLMRAWYSNLAERERRVVTLGAAAGVVLVLLAIILPLNRNIAQARQRITTKQGDLAFIQNAAPQLAAAGPGSGEAATGESLVVLIDSSARESGLGKSLSSSQATADKGLRIRLENVPFDALVAWLARLSQSHGVRVESAEIEAAGEPGLVNAGLLLKAG